jgi:hypothetical protein
MQVRTKIALAFILAGVLAGGCNESDDEVSSSLFLAPVAAGSKQDKRVTVLAERIDFLRAIRPNATDDELANIPTEPTVIGRPTLHDNASGSVTLLDEYVVFEGKTRSLLSATRCGDQPSHLCSDVTLHYDNKGFDNAQDAFVGSTISSRVGTFRLQNGWLLAFDALNGNLIAFRKEAPRTVVIDGLPREVKYRSSNNPDSKNFGAGNGLVISVVVSGEEFVEQTGFFQVARILELSPTELLVLFSSTRDIYVIELREEEDFVPWDLAQNPRNLFACDPQVAGPTCLPVKFLRGSIKLFPDPANPGSTRPLVRESEILAVTGGAEARLDQFPPVCLSACQDQASASPPSPCDRVLVFDQITASFLSLDLTRTDGKVSSAVVEMTATSQSLVQALEGFGGPYEFPSAFCDSQGTEVFIFEDESDSIVALNYALPSTSNNIRFFVGPTEIRNRRDPQGSRRTDAGGDLDLTFSSANARDNRIFYEDASRELLSVNYPAGVVVLALNPQDLETATDLLSRGNFSFMEPDSENDQKLIVLDRQSSTLLRIDLEYEALPVKQNI